ncbi:MAG: hypothetical protein CMM50_13580 [Rhodospirillaceae bacterium]|nr:hypothetical protein [Rhodospirillaceae bacterium]
MLARSTAAFLMLIASTGIAAAAEIWVGPDEPHKTIASAVKDSQPGDTVYVRAGLYANDFAEIKHDLTIIGVDGRAHIEATLQIGNGKGIFITSGDITLENLEFSGATVRDRNGAGIRYEGGKLTIRNCYFHDNEDGILAATAKGGEILIEDSEFARNGYGRGRTHGIYVNRIAKLTVKNSYFHDTKIGHHIKSRAAETHVIDSVLDDAKTVASYSVDMSNGGVGEIRGNKIIQGTGKGINSIFIAYGPEGMEYKDNRLVIEDNTFINHHTGGTLVKNWMGTPVEIRNNKIYNVPTIADGLAEIADNVIEAGIPKGDTDVAAAESAAPSEATPSVRPTPPASKPEPATAAPAPDQASSAAAPTLSLAEASVSRDADGRTMVEMHYTDETGENGQFLQFRIAAGNGRDRLGMQAYTEALKQARDFLDSEISASQGMN